MKNVLMVLFFAAFAFSGCNCFQIEPGERGVQVNFGKLQEPALSEGFGWTCPFMCRVSEISIRQQKHEIDTACYSSDLQQVNIKLAILYRIPEANVINIFRDFRGDPFDVLVLPRVQEALKEATSSRSAEQIVKQREQVKKEALESARAKIGDTLMVEDIVLVNIDLTDQLENAIEAKMVQEQEAAKAKYTKQKAEIDAETALVRAQGEANSVLVRAEAEAKSITIRGNALSKNPGVIQLELIQRWSGFSPEVVSGQAGLNILLPAASVK